MLILGISTSSNIASVALSKDAECIKELNINNNKTHSETLLPLINELLSETNIKLQDINLIACDNGPGSFTGIRIGISTVKAIAESLNIPVIAVSSLEGLAYNIHDSECICSLIDARNNQVYAGIFDDMHNPLEEYMADDINNVLEQIKKYNNINQNKYIELTKTIRNSAPNLIENIKNVSSLTSIFLTFDRKIDEIDLKMLEIMLFDKIINQKSIEDIKKDYPMAWH